MLLKDMLLLKALHLEQALEFADQHNMTEIVTLLKVNLAQAIINKDISQYVRLEKTALAGIRTLEQMKLKPLTARAYAGFGDFYTIARQRDMALDYFKRAGDLLREIGMNFGLGQMHETYHRLYKNEGDIPKAKEHLTRAIDIMKELDAYGWVERYEMKLVQLQ